MPPRSEKQIVNKHREAIVLELLDVLTKNRGSRFSPVILRSHIIAQATGISPLLDRITAAGASISDQMRDETCLAGACLLLQKLLG